MELKVDAAFLYWEILIAAQEECRLRVQRDRLVGPAARLFVSSVQRIGDTSGQCILVLGSIDKRDFLFLHLPPKQEGVLARELLRQLNIDVAKAMKLLKHSKSLGKLTKALLFAISL